MNERKQHFRNQLIFICVAQIGICICLAAVLAKLLPLAYVFGVVTLISIVMVLFRAFFWHVKDLPLDLNERVFDGYAETWAIFTLLPPLYFLTPLPEIFWNVESSSELIAYLAIVFTAFCLLIELLLFNRIVDFFCEEKSL